jgi:hypothetical protein
MNVVREEDVTVIAAHAAVPAPAPAGVLAPAAQSMRAPHRLQKILSLSPSLYLARRVQYVGKTGVGGVALLVFAIAFFMGANVSVRNEVGELRTSLDGARETGAGSANPQQSRALAARELMSTLPARSELPEITGKIVAQAQAAGIALDRGNYDFSVTHSGKLVRARMTFPVHGRYPDIRRFIDSTLADVPGAAVDGLRLGRKEIGATEIDAGIRFAVYVRGAP